MQDERSGKRKHSTIFLDEITRQAGTWTIRRTLELLQLKATLGKPLGDGKEHIMGLFREHKYHFELERTDERNEIMLIFHLVELGC